MSNEVSTEFVKFITITPWFGIQLFKGWGRGVHLQYNEHAFMRNKKYIYI